MTRRPYALKFARTVGCAVWRADDHSKSRKLAPNSVDVAPTLQPSASLYIGEVETSGGRCEHCRDEFLRRGGGGSNTFLTVFLVRPYLRADKAVCCCDRKHVLSNYARVFCRPKGRAGTP